MKNTDKTFAFTSFEIFREAILILDRDGTIIYANREAQRLTGFPMSALEGKSINMLYSDQEQGARAQYDLKLALEKGRHICEGWKSRKDGSRFWGEINFTLLAGNSKNQPIACTLRDVSDRKQQELSLRRSEERYRLMVEGVRDYSIFLLDPNGHILTWNEGAKRLTGYTESEVTGKHFTIFYPPEDIELKKPELEVRTAIETGKYEEEAWRVRKNGSRFWASIVLTALFNDQNQLIGFSKVTRDLTERREYEESLRQSEERLRGLVEQVRDYGIFMLDEKGRIVSWNEGARRIKGYSEEEILGKYFSIFYPEEDILSGKPAHELKVARKEGKYEEEGWRLRKGGERFWAHVVITAVYKSDGTHIGFSKVTRDLTERKKAEQQLRDSFEQYKSLASELQLANRELQLANEELEQFTSIASHDLQEPLRTIKSFLLVIEKKIESGDYENIDTYISKAVNGTNRMRELILNLLQYTQLGKKQVQMGDVNVGELVHQALQNLKSFAESSRAQIEFDCQVDTIQGDRIQLVQLMQNLLSNAIKFTDKEKPLVSISCVPENGHVKFAVSDNGIGISPEDQHKVFEIFRRLNTEKEYPGTGIGLAICKKIVDKHNGRIWPESTSGKGTTFYFTLHEQTRNLQPDHEEV